MTNSNNLKPRAVAAMCCLRGGPRMTITIRSALGDENSASTRDLLTDLRRDHGYVSHASSGGWHLTYEGIAWFESKHATRCALCSLTYSEHVLRRGRDCERFSPEAHS